MTEHANDGYINPTSPTGAGPRNASAIVDEAQAAATAAESNKGDKKASDEAKPKS